MRILLPALALLVIAAPAQGQWAWDVDLGAGVERATNLLRAPDVLLAEEAVRDSVLLNDVVLPARATIDVERAWRHAAVSLRYDGQFERYGGADQLDGARHGIRARAEAERGPVEARLEGQWRRIERVGVNVLGDIRPQLFRFTQPEAAARLRWTPTRLHRLTLSAAAYERDYQAREGVLPLDHREAEAEAAWRVRRRVSGRTLWAVEASVGLRERVYRTLPARDADGGRAEDHPPNRLRYFDVELSAERALGPTLSAEAEVGMRRRTDPFEDYYSYGSGAARAGLAWAPSDRVEVTLGGAFRRIHYDVQPAPQASGPEPTLRYHYLGWDAEATLRPLPGIELSGFVDGRRRLSNVSRETLVRRRSYHTSVVGLAVRLDVRRAAGGSD